MKAPYLYLFIISLLLNSCKSTSSQTEELISNCPKIYKDDFSEIIQKPYKTFINKDTLTFTEIRFQCTHSSFYTTRVMHGFHGLWHKSITPANSKTHLLIWENIDLLNDGVKYNIISFGEEMIGDIYSSIMVFDNQGNDILNEESDSKQKVIDFFAYHIRNNKNNSSEYYEEYLMEFAPLQYVKYKKRQKINSKYEKKRDRNKVYYIIR